jgi:hypothetical protein
MNSVHNILKTNVNQPLDGENVYQPAKRTTYYGLFAWDSTALKHDLLLQMLLEVSVAGGGAVSLLLLLLLLLLHLSIERASAERGQRKWKSRSFVRERRKVKPAGKNNMVSDRTESFISRPQQCNAWKELGGMVDW